MNKLKTTDLSGFPFDLDDLRFYDNAIREALKGIISAIGIVTEKNGILSGCLESGGTVSTGFVVIDDEVLLYPGGALPAASGTPGAVYHFRLLVSYDSAGLEEFENGTSHDTYEVRTAELVHAVPAGSHVLLNDSLPGFNAKAVRLIEGEPWHYVGDPGEPAYQNGWTQASSLGFRKEANGNVRLRGLCINSIANQDQVIFQLPVGYRPNYTLSGSTQITVTVMEDYAGTPVLKQALLLIGSNGNVILHSSINSIVTVNNLRLYLDDLSFSTR